MNRNEFLKTTLKGAVVGIIGFSHLSGLFKTSDSAWAQEKPSAPLSRADLIAAAREIMAAQQYCALTTIDEDGRPQIRTMNPFPPEDDMTVWIATNTESRKVRHMRRDPRVTLYYGNHGKAIGYVAITGKAVLVDDRAEMIKRKRGYWDSAFPDFKKLVLIKVIPERMDVLNYARNTAPDPVTWRTPSVDFKTPEPPAK
jgi:general stress protein 26